MKRLLLDLEKHNGCEKIKCSCSYPYHPYNSGIEALLEYATFTFICRKCEEAPCVKACLNEALEKLPGAGIKRYNNRCISCKSCMLACPFGTIIPEIVPYLSSACDFCLSRLEQGQRPICVDSCPEGLLEYREVEEAPDKNIYLLNDNLAVHCISWGGQLPVKKI